MAKIRNVELWDEVNRVLTVFHFRTQTDDVVFTRYQSPGFMKDRKEAKINLRKKGDPHYFGKTFIRELYKSL